MPTRPNILLITSHDLGRHLGCYGCSTVQSPHLDQLAGQGVRLAQAFCTAPQCSPSRASIATGRYPHSNGVMGLTHNPFLWDLHPEEQHVAQILSGSGYRTVFASTLHETRRSPQQAGFQETLPAGHSCHQQAAAVGQWLRESAGSDSRPFFLQMGFFEPHRASPEFYFGHPPDARKGIFVPPYLVNEHEARVEFSFFQGAISALDQAMGALLESLQAAGLTQNTLVLFAADHGIPFPRAKCSVYDPGLEVATLLRWPAGGLTGGKVISDMISNLDYLPTLLELLGLPIPAAVQGQSFAPQLHGRVGAPRQEIFAELTNHEYQDPLRCIRTRTHKLIVNFSTAPSFMDSSQTWRPRSITVHPEQPRLAYHSGPVELYDLIVDPLEQRNLCHDALQQTIRTDLLGRLKQWMVQTNDPLLAGIPTPPMHRLALHALSTGQVCDRPEQVQPPVVAPRPRP